MNSFEDFFKAFGFKEYPFSIFSAEGERQKLERLFVRPTIYAPIVETFSQRSSVILSGERGTGKTALVYELMRGAQPNALTIYIDDFGDLPLDHQLSDLYQFLIDHLAECLFKSIASKPWVIASRTKDERLLLTYLLKFHVKQLSTARLEEKIRKTQIHPIKRMSFWFYNRFRGLLNYSAAATLDITSDLIQRHFPGLPALEAIGSREYFPALSAERVESLDLATASYSLLSKVVELCDALGFTGVVLVLDKIDEEARLKNDAGKIADFLETLLTDNKLLLHSRIQLVIACWSIPLEQLKARVRFQKINVQRVSWDQNSLRDVLNKRLAIFSEGKVDSMTKIMDAEAAENAKDILSLANGNPRDLWHVMDSILKCQYELNSESDFISLKACQEGARRFVRDFNFYEYYPRSSNARTDSMDVYGYIAHLQKLDSDFFTKNQLSEQAGTGGSTNNYVVSMENMGLISKSDSKVAGGAVIYQIRDPKLIYARIHGVQIHRTN